MTVNWYRPSQCILVSVTISALLVTFGCLACGYLLHFAPEEPSKDISGGNFTFIPAICLAAASGLSLIALAFGCCGIFRDSKAVLMLFALVALVIAAFLLGISFSIFSFMMNGKIQSQIKDVMNTSLHDYNGSNSQEGNIFSHIQKDFKCCGVDGYQDWENTTWFDHSDSLAPSSCCNDSLAPSSCCKTIANCTRKLDNFYNKGCLHALYARIEYTVFSIFGFCIALSLLEVAMALLACYGAMLIKRYQNYDVL